MFFDTVRMQGSQAGKAVEVKEENIPSLSQMLAMEWEENGRGMWTLVMGMVLEHCTPET